MMNGWQRFADRMPTEEEQAEWLFTCKENNIGLPLGPQSGLVAVDIDTDDQAQIAAIQRVLPKSPWQRVGKKGMVLIYRWHDNPTARIKDENLKTICEILSRGTQIVIPPSIHPDTQKPYYANRDLLDVMKEIPVLPKDADMLIRGALEEIGIHVSKGNKFALTAFVPSGFRDNALVSRAGLFAMGIARGELTLIEALGRMKAWTEDNTEKVIGDAMDFAKGQQKLIEFLIRDVMGEKRKTLPVGWDEGLTADMKKEMGLDFSEEQVAWEYEKLDAYVRELIEQTKDTNSSAFLNSVEFILSRMSVSPIGIMQQDQLLKTISDYSAKRFSVVSMRKRIGELNSADVAGTDQNEIAGEVIKDLEKTGEIRSEGGKFWQWNGAYWGQIHDIEVLKIIARDYGSLPAARKESDHKGILRLIRTKTDKKLKELTISGLNFANGFLTPDLVLKPHDPDFGCVYMLNYRYIPELWDRCSLWTTFLYDIWGKDVDYEQKVLALQEAMAATLFGVAPQHQRVFCLFGPSATGKSTVRRVMELLIPAHTKSAINPADWGDKFLPAELYNKILNIAGELSEHKKIAAAQFKEIVCGETIAAQRKNQDPFSFQPTAAHWFSSNHLPKSDDGDTGFSRRWLFLTFNHKVPVEKRIPFFEEKLLEAEREEIVAWAARGIERLKSQGHYTLPDSHHSQEEQVNQSNNSVHYFLRACAKVTVGRARTERSTTQIALYAEYQFFLQSMGAARPVTLTNFRSKMSAMQEDFDFKVSERTSHRGHQEVVYDFITVADRSAGSRYTPGGGSRIAAN